MRVPDLRVTVVLCHVSDYARGFGGKYGVQKDRMDKVSAHQGLAPPAGTPGVVELVPAHCYTDGPRRAPGSGA